MKLGQPLLAVLFVCFSAVTVHADNVPVDGRVIVGSGSDPDSCGLTFKIHLNGNGGGIKNCQNTSGQDWIGLDIFATIPLRASVTCITPSSGTVDAVKAVFSTCNDVVRSTFDHKERIEIFLSGGTVPSGGLFFINLNGSGSSGSPDPNGAGGWLGSDTGLGNGNLDADAVVTPEPSAVWLLVSGLGLLAFARKLSSC